MSKLTEYINLAIKGLPYSIEILQSVINNVQMNYGTLPEKERAEIIRRRVICETCPFMSSKAKTSKEYFDLTGSNYSTARNEDHCSFCGCGLNMRTAALNKDCGIETWNKDNPSKQIPLKWVKFKKDGENKESSSGNTN